VDVVSEGVEEEAGLLLDVCVCPQNQKHIEGQFLQKDCRLIVLAALKNKSYRSHSILIVVLVVELAEAGHLLLHSFILPSKCCTVFDI